MVFSMLPSSFLMMSMILMLAIAVVAEPGPSDPLSNNTAGDVDDESDASDDCLGKITIYSMLVIVPSYLVPQEFNAPLTQTTLNEMTAEAATAVFMADHGVEQMTRRFIEQEFNMDTLVFITPRPGFQEHDTYWVFGNIKQRRNGESSVGFNDNSVKAIKSLMEERFPRQSGIKVEVIELSSIYKPITEDHINQLVEIRASAERLVEERKAESSLRLRAMNQLLKNTNRKISKKSDPQVVLTVEEEVQFEKILTRVRTEEDTKKASDIENEKKQIRKDLRSENRDADNSHPIIIRNDEDGAEIRRQQQEAEDAIVESRYAEKQREKRQIEHDKKFKLANAAAINSRNGAAHAEMQGLRKLKEHELTTSSSSCLMTLLNISPEQFQIAVSKPCCSQCSKSLKPFLAEGKDVTSLSKQHTVGGEKAAIPDMIDGSYAHLSIQQMEDMGNHLSKRSKAYVIPDSEVGTRWIQDSDITVNVKYEFALGDNDIVCGLQATAKSRIVKSLGQASCLVVQDIKLTLRDLKSEIKMAPAKGKAIVTAVKSVAETGFKAKGKEIVVEAAKNMKQVEITPTRSAKQAVRVALKPNISQVSKQVGGSGIIEDLCENIDRGGSASADTLVAQSGTYAPGSGPDGTRCTYGAYARVCTAEAKASFSVASAAARGPGAGAYAHFGPSGGSAFATVEICKAEASVAGIGASVGVSFNTGVSAGPEGLSACVGGFGVSIGPKMKLETPFVAISCSIM